MTKSMAMSKLGNKSFVLLTMNGVYCTMNATVGNGTRNFSEKANK